jgi:hypothetical protein
MKWYKHNNSFFVLPFEGAASLYKVNLENFFKKEISYIFRHAHENKAIYQAKEKKIAQKEIYLLDEMLPNIYKSVVNTFEALKKTLETTEQEARVREQNDFIYTGAGPDELKKRAQFYEAKKKLKNKIARIKAHIMDFDIEKRVSVLLTKKKNKITNIEKNKRLKRKIILIKQNQESFFIGQNAGLNYGVLTKKGAGFIFHCQERGGGSIFLKLNRAPTDDELKLGRLLALMFSKAWFKNFIFTAHVFKKEDIVIDKLNKGSFFANKIYKTISFTKPSLFLDLKNFCFNLFKGDWEILPGQDYSRNAFIQTLALSDEKKIKLNMLLPPYFNIKKI